MHYKTLSTILDLLSGPKKKHIKQPQGFFGIFFVHNPTLQLMSDEQPLEFEPGLAGDIAKSIMTPGYTASGVIQIMYYTFYALFATLIFMMAMTRGNPHVIALFLIALCLFVTIRWLVFIVLNFLRSGYIN